MKKSKNSVIYTLSFSIIIIMIVIGCSSTGIQRSEKATTTMKTVDNDIKLIVVQLDVTGASLDELTKSSQTDVKKAFDLYTSNVSKMETMEKDFAKHSVEMKARGKEYFEEWQKEDNQYKNPQIKALSEKRRLELDMIYSGIAENSHGVKEAFKKYISDAKEVQTFLSNDLTTDGIRAVEETSRKVVSDGENLKYAIKDIQTAIDRARAEMAQSAK